MERTAIFWARLHCRLTDRSQTKNWVVGCGIEHAAFFFPLCCRHIKAVGKKILLLLFVHSSFFFAAEQPPSSGMLGRSAVRVVYIYTCEHAGLFFRHV